MGKNKRVEDSPKGAQNAAEMVEQLKEAIKKAVELRENSWRVGTDSYSLDLREACDKACEIVGYDTRMTQIVWLLLFKCWNDALSWANED